MLTALSVQNLVVVREVEIEFGPGLTVLSGETGAGKSIIIEALGLALGERADSALIRVGAERATVSASFDLGALPALRALLESHELEAGDECVLRRVLTRDGRSRAFVNQSSVPLALLRELGERLVDIHAQHASQRLLRRETQRELLDAYAALGAEVAAVAAAHGRWRIAGEALADLERGGGGQERIELLRYQADELRAARVDAAEIGALETEHRRLAHGAANREHCAALRQALADDEQGAVAALRVATHRARGLARTAPEADALIELVEQALVGAEEAARELERVEAQFEVDPQRLARLDQRLAELHALARKHQVAMDELPALLGRLEEELARYDRRDGERQALLAARAEALAAHAATAAALSARRAAAATTMAADIATRLHTLGIPHARFEVRVEPLEDSPPAAHGRDRVEYEVATNPDQAAGPIQRVASGGELSRIGLAIQAATAGHSGVPVVVYDEVDSGIGGTTALTVGRSLRDVARHCQVLCITHSPQVASAGDRHVKVSKEVRGGSTETTLRVLERRAREEEIARMLGAAAATRASLAHARDLMAAAQQDG